MLTLCQSRVGDGLHPVQGPIVPLGSTGFLLWGRSSRWTPSCSRDPVPVIQLRLSPLCGYMGPFVPRGFSLCLPRPFITSIMVGYIQETGRFRIKWARTLTWESEPPLGASISPSVPGRFLPYLILTDDEGVALGGRSAFGIGPNSVAVC